MIREQDDIPLSVIHARIMSELERRKWSRMKLAEESGVAYSLIHRYSNGGSITTDSLQRLLDTLKLDVKAVKIR